MKHKHTNIWFTSDTHFYHSKVIKMCNRPFDDVEDMNESIINNYNKLVKKEDVGIFVGDIFFCSKTKARDIMSRLNGRKILVLGNHDRGMQSMLNIGFDWVCYEMWLPIAHTQVQIKHYPFLPTKWDLNVPWWQKFLISVEDRVKYADRRPKNEGQFLIHGHTHSKEKYNKKAIHIGVDANKFKPVSIFEIEKYIKNYNNG